MDIWGRVKSPLLHFTYVESLTSLQVDWLTLGATFATAPLLATAPCPLVVAQTESSEMALNLVRLNQAETFVYTADSPSPPLGGSVHVHSLTVACFVCGRRLARD